MTIYNNSVIYKISCKDENIKDVYIGATNDFKRRKSEHKKRCKKNIYKEYKFKVYEKIREYGGINNWNINVIEKCNVENKFELYSMENQLIRFYKPTLNTIFY
jgi:hypothetical protein